MNDLNTNTTPQSNPKYKPSYFEDALLLVLAKLSSNTTMNVDMNTTIQPICDLEGLENENSCGIQTSSNQPFIRRWIIGASKNLRKKGHLGDSCSKGYWCLSDQGLQAAQEIIAISLTPPVVMEQPPQPASAQNQIETLIEEGFHAQIGDTPEEPTTVEPVTAPVIIPERDPVTVEDVTEAIVASQKATEEAPTEADKAPEPVIEAVAPVIEETAPVEDENPTLADALLFAFCQKAGWARDDVDGHLYNVGDMLEHVTSLLNVTVKVNDLFDALFTLKQAGYLKGEEGRPGMAAVTIEGIERADDLGTRFFDDVQDDIETEAKAKEEAATAARDPYAGEEGSREDFSNAPTMLEEPQEGILWNDAYIKGLIHQGAVCFGESYNPEMEECQDCLLAVECYTSTKFRMFDEAKELPVRDFVAEKVAAFDAEMKAKEKAAKAPKTPKGPPSPPPAAPEFQLPSEEETGIEDPALNDEDLEEILAPNTTPANPTAIVSYTIAAAQRRANAGLPWNVHLEKVDPALNEDKFYTASAQPMREPLLHWGRNGAAGQTKNVTLSKAFDQLRSKLAKGYTYLVGYTDNDGIQADPPATTNDMVPILVSENGLVCGACSIALAVGTDALWDTRTSLSYHPHCVSGA